MGVKNWEEGDYRRAIAGLIQNDKFTLKKLKKVIKKMMTEKENDECGGN